MFTNEELKLMHYYLGMAVECNIEMGDDRDGVVAVILKLEGLIEPEGFRVLGRCHEPDCWQDFMIDEAEPYEGHTLVVEGKEYIIGDITDFIREYTWDNYTQRANSIEELVANGLLTEVK
jgi:hypothetical protein